MEDNLGMKSESSSTQPNLEFEGGIEQKDLAQKLHEPLTIENLEAAIQNLKNNVPIVEKGKLVARYASGPDKGEYPSGYYFCFVGLPPVLPDMWQEKTGVLYPIVLDKDEQDECQKLLVPDLAQVAEIEQPVQQLRNADVVDTEDKDDDVLYVRDDGTKVYRQDKFDRGRGTY